MNEKKISEQGKELINLLDQWINEPEIDGKIFNQGKLDKLNKTNVIIALLFGENCKNIKFTPPQKDKKYCFTFIITESVDIVDENHKKMFQQLIEITDSFAVAAINSKEIHVAFSVDNIWKE